eukprot:Clim_evm18s44 gene=Clim_evmTU18s44
MYKELNQYQVVGRSRPTAANPKPSLYRMKIFAPNELVAKSRFWYFIGKVVNLKKGTGQIIGVNQIFEKHPNKVKNFGIWLRYDSRTQTVNMYKEYRDTTASGAVTQAYLEMAARHRARSSVIQIIKVAEIKSSECRRTHITQMHDPNIKFPLPHRALRHPKSHRGKYQAKRPSSFY